MSEEIKLIIGEYYFSWDDEKALINVKKHKVPFEMAAEVFFDENAIEEPDPTTDEERYRIIGKAMSLSRPLLFVVYVERYTVNNTQVLRLISARYANKKEIKKYGY